MDEEAVEDPTPEVFGNKVVLREIFKYLPTSTLISSCSIVNRLWREEAFSFIRYKRECTLNLGFHKSTKMDRPTNLWQQLCELDRTLGKMDTIPFNSLRVLISDSNIDCDEEDADMNALTNLISRFPLKYLTVFEDGGMESCRYRRCPAASAILELVQENSSTLLELEIRSSWTGRSNGVFDDWEPTRFKNLIKLSIAQNSSVTSDCARKIIRGASNLRAIYNHSVDTIPENKYRTLKRLALCAKDVHQVDKFAGKLDRLEEVLVHFDFSYGNTHQIRTRNLAILQDLLALNALTLCGLDIRSLENSTWCHELELPLLPFVNVFFISVLSFLGSPSHISRLDFRGSFPNLRKVSISEDIRFTSSYSNRCAGMVHDEDEVMIEPNASETTLELSIDGSINPLNLLTLRRVFPNIISLAVGNRHYFPPLGLIGSFWPNLQRLRISIQSLREEEVSAEVFGLDSQEWKLLRRRDKEFLTRVQLAPSRPCVWTMRELKHFQLEYQTSHYLSKPETFCEFMETLAIGRMSRLTFKIKQGLIEHNWRTARFKDFGEGFSPCGRF